MISKIMSTPQQAFVANHSANNCAPKKSSALNFNSGLKADTVSFTSKVNTIDEVVHRAFSKLAQNRKNNGLGTYLATSDKVNIFLQETKLGKEAKLTLTDGIFGDKSYANFNISRSIGKRAKITPADEDMSIKEAKSMVKAYLQDLK